MNAILIISGNTFKEVIRDRILYSLIVFTLLLLLLSLALGQLSFDENIRISANFGFTGIHISIAALSIFVGSSLVAKEIEKQTILTLLARPISRGEFIVGKALGLFSVLAVVVCGLAAILAGFLALLGFEFRASFPIAVWGVLLEGAILLSLALVFGAFSRPLLTVAFTVSLFLIGHWTDSLGYFISKSESFAFKSVATVIRYVVPDLERLNWRSAPVYGIDVPAQELAMASLGALGWVLVLISLTVLIFRRRDFV